MPGAVGSSGGGIGGGGVKFNEGANDYHQYMSQAVSGMPGEYDPNAQNRSNMDYQFHDHTMMMGRHSQVGSQSMKQKRGSNYRVLGNDEFSKKRASRSDPN